MLHLSPPCQIWSPAHTKPGQNDEANRAALFSCKGLIQKTRPRIITLEQTFGIVWEQHRYYFWAFIGDITDLGYSVRWKVVRLCTWGSPQDRKRLIMIASAPGEHLPTFPRPTHSEDGSGGTRRFNTIASTIARIREGDDLHNVHDVLHYNPPKAPYDADKLGYTITTGGVTSHHPSSTRAWTLRELAAMQGFPKNHRFYGTQTQIKRQIGNAFPSNTVRVLYKHLHDWLLKEDNACMYVPEDDVMVVDDDSDESDVASVIFDEERSSPLMSDEDVVMADEDVVFVGASRRM